MGQPGRWKGSYSILNTMKIKVGISKSRLVNPDLWVIMSNLWMVGWLFVDVALEQDTYVYVHKALIMPHFAVVDC